jgi:multidrug efflux system outer membrane protein
MRRTLSFLLSVTLLASCTVGPKYKRPEVTVPDQFRGASASQSSAFADTAWWGGLTDDALRGLIEDAVKNGYDVRLAAWRVEEARANAGIAASELYPAIQGSAGWSKTQQAFFPFQFQLPSQELYSVNIGLSWEIDLWGRIRHLKEAALARYLATEEARRGVQISLVSDVAAGYFQLRALDFQLEIAKRTSEAFRGTQGLFQRRLEAGLASTLETASATASLATTNATIPELERRIAEQENRLSLLIGHPPREVPRGAPLEEQLLPPEVPIGLPSDLLKRRPDILEAEQQLIAANAEVGVAVADYFPRISLTAAYGGIAPQVSQLFDEGKTWSIGAGLVTPVFQGTRLKNNKRAAQARWEQAKVQYERSVTNAFVEVANALIAYQKLADTERELATSVDAYREAVRVSNSRYLSGLSDYLEVLQAQRQLFPAEQALAQTRYERLASLVDLYRALGGGWQEASNAS